MPVQKITRNEILQKAMLVFKRQGYHRTTMDDLARACGLLKGSFYYYFSSKQVLMKEVLHYVNSYNQQHLFPIAYDNTIPPKERMEQLLTALFNGIIRSEGGCLMGNMVLETALVSDEFKEPLQTHFNTVMAAIAHIYQTTHPEQKALELAQRVAIEIQGSLVLVKLFHHEELLRDCCKRAIARL